MTTAAQFSGPTVILSVHPVSEQLNLYDLLTGQVLTKNYKQVREAFSKNVFSLPLFPHLGEEIQFRVVQPTSRIKQVESAQNVLANSSKIILNVHKLLLFLSPILPNRPNTQAFLRTVHVRDQDDDQNAGDDDVEDVEEPVAVEPMQDNDNDDSANDGDNHNGDDQIKLVNKPSVKFNLPSPGTVDDNDNDDNTSNDDHAGDHDNNNVSDDDGNNDDIDNDGVDHLHLLASDPNAIPTNSSQTMPLAKDMIVPRRPKFSSPSSFPSNKYNLRQNPKAKNVLDI